MRKPTYITVIEFRDVTKTMDYTLPGNYLQYFSFVLMINDQTDQTSRDSETRREFWFLKVHIELCQKVKLWKPCESDALKGFAAVKF
jgi:hypothetical protein